MPSKKKKYNARFPAGRIKKIMQTDEEVGKVAQAVPVIISRTLELFVGSLLNKAMQITSAKNAKTLSPSHMKQCILSEQRFDFLKDLVKTVQDTTNGEDESAPGTPSQGQLPVTAASEPGSHRRIVSAQRRRSSGAVKEEPLSHHESAIKPEPVVKEENELDPYANCSTVHLKPNFYTETEPEQKVSVHRPPLVSGHYPATATTPRPSYSDHMHSPVLVMDEDYDT